MPAVETSGGTVRGVTMHAPTGRRVHRFLGIPYGAAPIGDLRWRAPVPVEPWAGARDALDFAPAAPQRDAVESALPGFVPDGPTSEDCLALNVWTPGLDGTRPVVVWFPGGAYLSGGTSQPVYDGERLADEGDVVVVTVGYRLGALGFLALDGDADANCGLRDQLAALAWVREHASAFGGDPTRITAMGESAGAGSVLHLLASPKRGDAFDRAIIQSGQPTTLDADVAAEVAVELARRLGLDEPDVARLREVPVERLLDAQEAATGALLGRVGLMPFAPSIDGDLCDRPILDAVTRGRGGAVDVVIGTTRDELALFPDPRADALDDARLVRRIGALGPAIDAELVLAHYRDVLGAHASNRRVWDAVRTDAMMRAPNLRVARARTQRAEPTNTFVYRFDWEAPRLGAAHAVDLPFTFGTFDREGWGDVVGHDERAERLGVEWRRAWVRFAHDGDPGWTRHEVDGSTIVFDPDAAHETGEVDVTVERCWISG